MNRIQTFSLFLGTLFFVFAGVLLESLRYTYDRTLWPSIGDIILILFLVALITAGLFWIFTERWRVWPILLSTIIGLILGASSYFLFMTFAPEYTANTFIKVSPPVEKDPMTIASVQVDRDILYRQCVAMTELITQQSIFEELLRRDEIRTTKWFQSFGSDIVDAADDLKDNLIAVADRDSGFIRISMSCRDKDDAALIVNQMVDAFIKSQAAKSTAEIAEKLAQLREQEQKLQADVQQVGSAMNELRMASADNNITDLGEHTFQNSISTRLDNLQSEHDKLVQDIQQAEVVVGNLQELTAEPNSVQVALQVENYVKSDPIMVTLSQQLILKELELAEKATGSNSNQPTDSQTERVIKIIREKIQTRKALIRDSIRLADFKNAQDQLVVLKTRLDKLQQMLAEASAKKKDLDIQRSRYETLANLRDERQKRLNEVKLQIEKVNMMLNDPETCKVASVGRASAPLEASFPKLKIFLASGTLLGFIIGAGISLCIRKAKEQNIAKDL